MPRSMETRGSHLRSQSRSLDQRRTAAMQPSRRGGGRRFESLNSYPGAVTVGWGTKPFKTRPPLCLAPGG